MCGTIRAEYPSLGSSQILGLLSSKCTAHDWPLPQPLMSVNLAQHFEVVAILHQVLQQNMGKICGLSLLGGITSVNSLLKCIINDVQGLGCTGYCASAGWHAAVGQRAATGPTSRPFGQSS